LNDACCRTAIQTPDPQKHWLLLEWNDGKSAEQQIAHRSKAQGKAQRTGSPRHTMSQGDISNWIAIYIATFWLCGVAFTLSVATVMAEMIRERFWKTLECPRDYFLFIPRTWWRWQKRYLLGTPAILLVISVFAASMEWGQ